MFSFLTRNTTLTFQVSKFLTRAKAPAAPAAGKKKGAAVKKKRFDRGNEPLKFEKMAPSLFKCTLPGDKDSEYPAWLLDGTLDPQLPSSKGVPILSAEAGARYYKQISKKEIKAFNNIMKLTKGRGL
ncbi:hypothetical protein CYY_001402 [Polysphondylium violaceum]|uniref:Uncharacterized protein n=1 Tax=Polysphondylium violaceum TaxID=133409 RepID=A0A8J4Q353_9MYCE|nr:hypothetical protein CYY_001402 [Polysphondylium violaceum]